MRNTRMWSWLGAMALVVAGVGADWGWGLYQEHKACLRRGAQFDSLVQKLQREAAAELPTGAKRQRIEEFLKKRRMAISHYDGPARIEGSLLANGCSHTWACGDEVFLTLDIFVDAEGSVIGPPQIESRYEDCL